MAADPAVETVGNDRGTAAIEALAGALFATAFISGGLALTYTVLAHLWIQNSAYEASICLSTSQPVSTCEKEMRSKIERVLSAGSLARLQLQRSTGSARVRAVWITPGGFRLAAEDQRSLPLLGQTSRPR